MVSGFYDGCTLLSTEFERPDPLILPHLIQGSPFGGIQLQHSSDYVTGLAREHSQEPIGALWRRLSGPLDFARRWVRSGSFDRWQRIRRQGEQPERIIRLARRLPREASKNHAAEDDGKGPDICWLRIVLQVVANLGRQVRIGPNNS